jgi:hypothetical protein
VDERFESPDTFSAPWGASLKLTSALCLFLLPGISVILFQLNNHPVFRTLIAPLPLILLAGSAVFLIRGYRVANGFLFVRRLFWETAIPLSGLASAEARPGAMRSSIRLMGNGGLFSFTGLFWNKALGRYRAYVTDLTRCVVLHFRDRVIVISPASPERFIQSLPRPARA